MMRNKMVTNPDEYGWQCFALDGYEEYGPYIKECKRYRRHVAYRKRCGLAYEYFYRIVLMDTSDRFIDGKWCQENGFSSVESAKDAADKKVLELSMESGQ